MESLTLMWAKRYLKLGWSVIPLQPGNKTPLLSPIPYRTRLATEGEIKAWFQNGRNNLGLVTGALSSLAVVDLDGVFGLKSGMQFTTPSAVLTGKGKQLYYRWMTERNAIRTLPGLDIRGEGGYVVAPPSIHPNGKRYIWQMGPTNVLPEFPKILLSSVDVSNAPIAENQQGWEAEALDTMEEGQRHDTLTRIAGKLHRGGMAPSSVAALLIPHAEAAGIPASDVEHIAESVSRYERPADTSEDSEPIDTFLQNITPVGWICAPFFARKSIGFVAGLPETLKTWLLIDLAVECARGGGKWLGQFHCAPARVLFIDQERFKGETQRRFKAVLRAKGIDARGIRGSLSVKTGSTIRINLEQSYNSFRRELSDFRPDVCMVDSFATFHTCEENDRMAIQLVMDRLKTLRNEFGTTFIFIDHENKSVYSDKENGQEATAFRIVGSVGKIAAVEFALTVRKITPGNSIIHHTKSTLAPASKSFYAQISDTPDNGVKIEGKI